MSAQGLSSPRNEGMYLPQAIFAATNTVAGAYPPTSNLVLTTGTLALDDGFFLIPGDTTALGIRDAGRYELTVIADNGSAGFASFSDFYIEAGPNFAFNFFWRSSPCPTFSVGFRAEITDYIDAKAGDVWRFRCYEESGTQTIIFTVIMTKIG
jgi:hypothetical protein